MFAFAWLYLCSTAWFADLLMGSLENQNPPKVLSVLPRAQAIVVLGGTTRGDTHFSQMADLNSSADRLSYAAQLYGAGKAPLVLLSGGRNSIDERAEAERMEDYMVLMGVPKEAILKERESRDTHQNAVYSAILLKGHGINTILLVTSGFHMPRARSVFEAQGLSVIPAPTDFQRLVSAPAVPRWLPSVDDLQRTTYAIREYVGAIYYQIQGWAPISPGFL